MRRYEQRRSGGAFKFIIVIVLILLVWGYLGAKQVEKTGLPCKIGLSEKLCWSWEKQTNNTVNNVTQDINDSLSKTLKKK